MSIVMVRNLVKEYPSFRLNSVTFSLEAGKITGFIGRKRCRENYDNKIYAQPCPSGRRRDYLF